MSSVSIQYHKAVGMVVVGLSVVLAVVVILQVLTEGLVEELPPFPVVDVLTGSAKIMGIENLIHKVSSQDTEAVQNTII